MSKNNQKKKSGGKIAAGAGVVAVAAALLFLGPGMGLGKGSGQGEGTNPPVSTTAPQNVTDPTTVPQTTADAVKVIVSVSVVESDYFYQNQKYTLDDLVTLLTGMEEGYIVQITDSNASLNAYNNLTAKLTQLSIPYTEG